MSVAENLLALKSEIPEHVILVAVSKTKPPEMIREAFETGHRDFGENYVQELTDKQLLLPADINWHFIGHLQTNKVKFIAPFVHLIHGVDSMKLLKEINKQGEKNGRVISVLLQLRIAREETKFGLPFDACGALLKEAKELGLKHVKISGFMAMATNTGNMEEVKSEFLSVKEFHKTMREQYPELQILSYGMSGDYREAISCGSNMVRIGSLIFGERSYA